MAHFRINLDVAARLLDKAVDHAQPQPGTFAEFLSGEERIEDPVQDLCLDSGSAIGHDDQHVLTGVNVTLLSGIFLVYACVRGLDGEPAATRHRITRVEA